MSDSSSRIQREDISSTVDRGQPALEIGDRTLRLFTTFDGMEPEDVEVDWFGEGFYFIVKFDDGRRAEITPEWLGGDDDGE